jgi:hypothetical protein
MHLFMVQGQSSSRCDSLLLQSVRMSHAVHETSHFGTISSMSYPERSRNVSTRPWNGVKDRSVPMPASVTLR